MNSPSPRQRPLSGGTTLALSLCILCALLLQSCVSAPTELRCSPQVSGRFYEDPSVTSSQARIERRLIEEAEAQKIPALGVAIHGERERIELAFGSRGPERKTPITLDARFRVGTVSKLFTAVVILSLVEEDRLSLEQSVAGWFPELPRGESITVGHLLQHSSGVAEYRSSPFATLGAVLRPGRRWEPEEILRRIVRSQPEFEPGTGYDYSNSNYVLLGIVAERVTGESFSSLLERYITEPLGLSDTYLAPAPRGPETEKLLTGYDYDLLPFGNHRIVPDNSAWPSWAFTAGGIVSTPEDMARFLSSLFEGRLLSTRSVDLMTEYSPATQEQLPAMVGYGLGMRVLEIRGDLFYGHTGTIPGFGALLVYWPERSTAIAMAANRSSIDAESLLSAVVSQLTE